MTAFFTEDSSYTGPPLEAGSIARAEQLLGYTLPSAYVELLGERNGGVPQRRYLRTPWPTSWADDHIKIDAIKGVDGKWGIDSNAGLGSQDLVKEWGYPPIGIVVCRLPSGGDDAVMLDYRVCGPNGAPAVAYVDEERNIRILTPTFEAFVNALQSSPPSPT